MKARFLSLVVSLGLGAALLAPTPLRAQKLIDSTTAIPVFGLAFMVEMYAQDTQLYQKHGVNMKMLQLNGLGTINAVIAGSIDFGQPSGGSVTRAASRGQPLLAIVMLNDRVPTEVVLRKDVAEELHFDAKAPLVQRAALLKGRTIAVDAIASVIDAYVGLLAKQAGFTHDDIHVAPMEPPSMIAALKAKQIDGFAMALPWTTIPVVDGSAVMLASGPSGDSIGLSPFAGSLVVAQPATCAKKPQLCEDVAQTFKDAIAEMHAHPDAAEAVIAKRFPTTDPKGAAHRVPGRARRDAEPAGAECESDRECRQLQCRRRAHEARGETLQLQ
ncbi:MAG TPA: ABC transporter substrate-binding protein [Stellaceae bacterium]|nr:ABC transporter substrate-binding protein [Stellaceae bacterium]